MPQKYCGKFQPPEQGARTLQMTDRRQTDGRQHIANVNVSSRSLKTKKWNTEGISVQMKRTMHFSQYKRLRSLSLLLGITTRVPKHCLEVNEMLAGYSDLNYVLPQENIRPHLYTLSQKITQRCEPKFRTSTDKTQHSEVLPAGRAQKHLNMGALLHCVPKTSNLVLL